MNVSRIFQGHAEELVLIILLSITCLVINLLYCPTFHCKGKLLLILVTTYPSGANFCNFSYFNNNQLGLLILNARNNSSNIIFTIYCTCSIKSTLLI